MVSIDDNNESISSEETVEENTVDGTVARRIAGGSFETDGNSVGAVPAHIRKMADENPGKVTMMEWQPQKTFQPIDPSDLARFQNYIHREFIGLLAGKGTDEEHRKRMLSHKPICDFAERHPILFTKLTTRDIATNPRLMYPLKFQLHVREKVLRGELTEDQGKAMVATAAMQAIVGESVARGAMTPEKAAGLLQKQ
jgi:hypothetical protein